MTRSARPAHSVNIHIGGVFASRRPQVVRTILGSCIAVCLYDPLAMVGGMNHFLLPDGGDDGEVSARYGIHAMELLVNECMKSGADRSRLEAKVFGGGHVLRVASIAMSVPRLNIRFAIDFLETESIPIVTQDVGGTSTREVYFYTDTGRVLMRRLKPTQLVADDLKIIMNDEVEAAQHLTFGGSADDSNVTLF